MKYVVFQTGGKQYKVSEGQILEIEKVDKKPKEKIEFNKVFLWVNEEERKLGQPLVEGAKVEAEVLAQIRGPKIHVAKFKAKARYRKKIGHRQELTQVRIEKISEGTKRELKKEIPQGAKKAKVAPKNSKA